MRFLDLLKPTFLNSKYSKVSVLIINSLELLNWISCGGVAWHQTRFLALRAQSISDKSRTLWCQSMNSNINNWMQVYIFPSLSISNFDYRVAFGSFVFQKLQSYRYLVISYWNKWLQTFLKTVSLICQIPYASFNTRF